MRTRYAIGYCDSVLDLAETEITVLNKVFNDMRRELQEVIPNIPLPSITLSRDRIGNKPPVLKLIMDIRVEDYNHENKF